VTGLGSANGLAQIARGLVLAALSFGLVYWINNCKANQNDGEKNLVPPAEKARKKQEEILDQQDKARKQDELHDQELDEVIRAIEAIKAVLDASNVALPSDKQALMNNLKAAKVHHRLSRIEKVKKDATPAVLTVASTSTYSSYSSSSSKGEHDTSDDEDHGQRVVEMSQRTKPGPDPDQARVSSDNNNNNNNSSSSSSSSSISKYVVDDDYVDAPTTKKKPEEPSSPILHQHQQHQQQQQQEMFLSTNERTAALERQLDRLLSLIEGTLALSTTSSSATSPPTPTHTSPSRKPQSDGRVVPEG